MTERNKYDFITELLDNPNLKPNQLNKLVHLATQEIKSDSSIGSDLEKRIKALEESLAQFDNPEVKKNIENASKNKVFHKPKKVSDFLKLFKENTDLKWTTHTWDSMKYNTIEDFINALNENKKYSFLYKLNRDLYNLIRYFIYVPSTELKNDGVPKYGWPNLNEMKFGWQYPKNLLIDWCKENYDNKNVDERKKPFQFLLPTKLRPRKLVKGREVMYFEDVVNVFKTEIQFREKYLYKELRKRSRSMTDFNFIGIDDAKTLNFYTYTPGVLSAIDHILEQIKTNETALDIKFSFEEKDDKLTISICQINSYPISKELNPNNPNSFVGGQLNAIGESLFSLADFSVESKFKHNGGNHCGILNLTFDGLEGEMEGKNISLLNPPKFIPFNETEKEVPGFTYKMTFYI